ncbi:MAG: hypothetical protein ACYCZA_06330 [Thiobacillus sp.]
MKRTLILLLTLLTAAAGAAPFPAVSVVKSLDLTQSEPATLRGKAWLEDYQALMNAMGAYQGYALGASLLELKTQLNNLTQAPPGFFRPPDAGSWVLAGHTLQLLRVDTPEIAPRADVTRGRLASHASAGNLLVASDQLVWLPVTPLLQAVNDAQGTLDPAPGDSVEAKTVLGNALRGISRETRYRDAALLSAYATLEQAIEATPVESDALRIRLRSAAIALDHEPGLQTLSSELEALAQQSKTSDRVLVGLAAKLRGTIEARARAAMNDSK